MDLDVARGMNINLWGLPSYNLSQKSSAGQLQRLRQLMVDYELDGYLIVDSDAHYTFNGKTYQDRRISFITGSDAQSGIAIVGKEKAAFKPDNAHLLMADLQTDDNWEVLHQSQTIESWARKEITGRIGYDPTLTPIGMFDKLGQNLSNLVAVHANLVALVETGNSKPIRTLPNIRILQKEFSGANSRDKLGYVRQRMSEYDCDCYVLTALDEIAYLLNIRGDEIKWNPYVYTFLVFLPDEIFLFIDDPHFWHAIVSSTSGAVRRRLPYRSFYEFLFGHASSFKRWWVDPRSAIAVVHALGRGRLFLRDSVVQEMKEVKNKVEISGMQSSHARDCGAAVLASCVFANSKCDTFGWLEEMVYFGNMVKESYVSKRLVEFQRSRNHYIGPSFDPHASIAINSATVDYVPDADYCAYIGTDSMFTLDAGGNYQDGTTTFARTIHFGMPTELEKEIYTRLLKGILAIESIPFPEGTSGHQLDTVIRQHLWLGGFDCPGIETGHGISHGLGSIRGGVSISSTKEGDIFGLKEGMTISIGPGIYLPSLFGIRLKNVYLVTAHHMPQYTLLHPTLATQPKFLKLDVLSYLPYQRKMVKETLVTEQEWGLLGNYHSLCLTRLNSECGTDAGRAWVQHEASAWLS